MEFKTESLSTTTYSKKCPFCGAERSMSLGCNIICGCNAKYYYNERLWLNRNTGTRIYEEKAEKGSAR